MGEEAKHTQGPWSVFDYYSDENGFMSVVAADNELISDVFPLLRRDGTRKRELEEDRSNARLIAAAPDMLAACKAAIEFYDALPEPHRAQEPAILDRLQAVVAKAEGLTS